MVNIIIITMVQNHYCYFVLLFLNQTSIDKISNTLKKSKEAYYDSQLIGGLKLKIED